MGSNNKINKSQTSTNITVNINNNLNNNINNNINNNSNYNSNNNLNESKKSKKKEKEKEKKNTNDDEKEKSNSTSSDTESSVTLLQSILFIILVVVVFRLYFGDFNMVKRSALDKSNVIETDYYKDELGVITEPQVLEEGMISFYETTGIQPFLLIVDNIDGYKSPSNSVGKKYIEKEYGNLFSDEQHLLVILLESNVRYDTWIYSGSKASKIMNKRSNKILDKNIELEYDRDKSNEEIFSDAFFETSQQIMTVKKAGSNLISNFLIGLLIVLYYYLSKKNEKKAEIVKIVKEIEEIKKSAREYKILVEEVSAKEGVTKRKIEKLKSKLNLMDEFITHAIKINEDSDAKTLILGKNFIEEKINSELAKLDLECIHTIQVEETYTELLTRILDLENIHQELKKKKGKKAEPIIKKESIDSEFILEKRIYEDDFVDDLFFDLDEDAEFLMKKYKIIYDKE